MKKLVKPIYVQGKRSYSDEYLFVFNDAIRLDENGDLNDFAEGNQNHGYRIFYAADIEIVEKYFSVIPDGCIGGELEFTINANGEAVDEVLLWTTVEDSNGDCINVEFVAYPEDITSIVDNCNEHIKRFATLSKK